METLNAMSNILMGFWPVITSLFGLFTAILGLYARTLKMQIAAVRSDLDDVKEDLDTAVTKAETLSNAFNEYQKEILRTYMPAIDVKSMVDELKAYLIRIEDKVDHRSTP